LPHLNSRAKDSREKIRRLIVNVILIIYWLLIFEGALRKWILPFLHKALFFVRDPFVLYVYYLSIKHDMWPKWTPLFTFGCATGLFYIALALAQSLFNQINPLVTVIGWRSYFWYLPLAFIIGEQMRGKDLLRLIRHTLIISIPVSCITFMQYKTGLGSFWNKTLGDDPGFLAVGEVVRTSGTFTFSGCQTLFISSCICMVMTVWLLPKSDRPVGRILLLLATGATLENFYVSFSRGAFFGAGICMVTAMVSGLIIRDRGQKLRALFIPGIITAIGAVFYVTVFAHAYETMLERQAMATGHEGSTLVRAAGNLLSLFEALPRMTFIGYGLGLGSNAGAVIASGSRNLAMGEMELPKIITEAGFAGLAYIGFRFWLFFWLLKEAIEATRRSNNPFPFILFSFTGVLLFVGQMTLQGTINGYGWLFAGFCIAANNMGLSHTVAPIFRRRKNPYKSAGRSSQLPANLSFRPDSEQQE
jgi:hypothetical protein